MTERSQPNSAPTKPIMCSQGGFAYNGEHIEYWKARALAAETARYALVKALRLFADPASWRLGGSCDPNSGAFRGEEIAQKALAALEDQS